MPASHELTSKQIEATKVLGGEATHVLLYGGSRSGKTFAALRAIAYRALAAKNSRHAVLRFRFNHVKASIVLDTWPKMMSLCYPQVPWRMDKGDWYAEMPNKSQIWFGGLDDKERTEKVLGQEHATLYFNEASQIPYSSRNLAVTRLAQSTVATIDKVSRPMRLKAYYDCNPPSQAHWLYQLFFRHRDPESKEPLPNPSDYASLQLNPSDNLANLPADYLQRLESLPARMRVRFLEGKFADISASALWNIELIEKWRSLHGAPDMQRIAIGVDPSGAGDTDNADNDAIGIIVAGVGIDGNGYVLEDLTCKAGPGTWAQIVASAFDRWDADVVVGESNYGGAMVEHTIQVARPRTPFVSVTATRGKSVRAEPISALTEQGKIRFAGYFPELEDELCGFSTAGYSGSTSPNRADAFVWAFSELFPGLVKKESRIVSARNVEVVGSWRESDSNTDWMAA